MEEKNEKNIYIKVKSDGKIYRANAGNLDLKDSDEILFEIDQFQDIGLVIAGKEEEFNGNLNLENSLTIIRKLTEKDKEKILEKKEEAKKLLPKCQEKIKKHDLSMDLLDAELSYDGKKLTFYFSSNGRVDFRSLVPDLASTFKKLIRLQQVGSRDKAKSLACVGRCGRETCCRKFLKGDLESVTLEMACDQNLGQMGSSRVTGACGKLMCCLKYELKNYQDKKKSMPAIDQEVNTPEGKGRVVAQNIIKNKITVELFADKRILEVDC